ncbi:MAG: MBL fold metallo-hydrolase [Theionarchaea archaeon]|nr:MBL fold metallo-hydrolase [Theionarchaea archaeon]
MKLTEKCYCVTGLAHSDCFSVNAGFVVGEKETIVIDSGFTTESAKTIYGYCQAVKTQRISYVINLEGHYDHIFGDGFFIDKGAKIVAHSSVYLEKQDIDEFVHSSNKEIKIKSRRKNKEAFIYFRGVTPFTPDIGVERDMDLDIEGVTLKIYVAPGHTETNLIGFTDLIVYVEEEDVAYVADTVYSGYLPTLRFGNEKLWRLWLKSLDLLEQLNPGIVVPGHGEVLYKESLEKEIERHRKVLEKYIE